MSQHSLSARKTRSTILRMTTGGLFMALIIVLSSFGITVPGGHLYLVDIAVVTASLLLDPVDAMIVSGVGAFLGDAIFYPAPMFVSLVVHGLQAFVISSLSRRIFKDKPFWGALIACVIGGVILVAGYTLGKIYVYSTFEYAMIKLPYEIAQAVIGIVCGLFLTYGLGLKKRFDQMMNSGR